jgi:hypothetical protein
VVRPGTPKSADPDARWRRVKALVDRGIINDTADKETIDE